MKKIKNSTLLILFIVLLVAVAAVFLYDRNKGDRTFKSQLFTIDSIRVSSISIYPKGSSDAMILSGSGNNWTIRFKDQSFPADTQSIRQILSAVIHAIPERVATTDLSGWKEFEITDSATTRVVIKEGDETTADFRLGKLSFSQINQGQGYGRGQNIIVKSHIRIAGDEKVYVVDGFLSMMFSDQSARYRNKLVSRFDRTFPVRFSFTYPGDSSFQLVKTGARWMIGDKPADSARVESFISSLSQSSNMEMADDNRTVPGIFPFQLSIEGNNMSSIRIEGAIDLASGRHYVKSSMNRESIFASANESLFRQFFKGKGYFFPSPEKKKESNK